MFLSISRWFDNPANSASFAMINLLLGVGPLIVPTVFYRAGIVLSLLWMVIIWSISFKCANYVGESMAMLS